MNHFDVHFYVWGSQDDSKVHFLNNNCGFFQNDGVEASLYKYPLSKD